MFLFQSLKKGVRLTGNVIKPMNRFGMRRLGHIFLMVSCNFLDYQLKGLINGTLGNVDDRGITLCNADLATRSKI